MRENLAAALRLLLVTDDTLFAGRDVIDVCRAAIRGGVTSIQLRFKRMPDPELLALARAAVNAMDVPVFLNDRLDIALAAGAAGVHLGPDDLPPVLARQISPPGFVIGASVGSANELLRGESADYWGIGPLHRTTTKADAGAALGIEGVTSLLRAAGGRPCVAIGSVSPNDVAGLVAAGFAGVAVVRGILGAEDTEVAVRRYRAS